MPNVSSLPGLLANLEEGPTLAAVQESLDAGQEPRAILDALNEGMTAVGDKFAVREYYLSELIMAAEIFQGAMDILEPHLIAREGGRAVVGSIVIGTVQGDLHDIGKNIFVALARNAGFQVEDLGTDVAPAAFVERVKQDKADILGLSGILTMALQPMADTVHLLEEAGLRESVRVIIGGAAIDEQWRERVGADACTDDAYEGLQMVKDLLGVQ
ncbi:MAG: cobalamin-dependent protein [Anaerolineae bacterium]|jgi:methanogenic corrinoid protein MtbC1